MGSAAWLAELPRLPRITLLWCAAWPAGLPRRAESPGSGRQRGHKHRVRREAALHLLRLWPFG